MTFKDYGITGIDESRKEQQRATCPKCSADRNKANDTCLSVNVDKGVWFCWHCLWTGGLKDESHQLIVREVRNLTQRPTKKLYDYFASRGIDSDIVDYNRIREDDISFGKDKGRKWAIAFPYYLGTKLVNIKYRSLDKDFIQSTGTTFKSFYNINDAIWQESVVITEGECFLGPTEILTESGWQRFDSYDGNNVAEVYFDAADIPSIRYVKPTALVNHIYHGDIYVFSNSQRYYSLTTQGHDYLLLTPKGWRKVKAYELYSKRISNHIPRFAIFNGEGVELTDEQLRLFVAVSADFSIRNSGDIYGAFKKDRKKERIEDLLKKLQLRYSINKDSRSYWSIFIHHKQGLDFLSKEFPHSWVSKLSRHQIGIILDEILYWDGNSVPNRKQIEYSSKLYSNATFIQTLAHLYGYVSTIMKRQNKFGSWYKVSILFNKRYTSTQSLTKKAYNISEEVYCVSVPSGNIMVRQNDCISVIGNCDALSFQQAGIMNVMSVPDGAPSPDAKELSQKFSFLDNCIEFLRGINKFYLACDKDPNGVKLKDELARRLGKAKCMVVDYPDGCKDANDVLVKYGSQKLAQCVRDATPYPVEGVFNVKDVMVEVMDIYKNGFPEGIKTGWRSLDEYFTVHPGMLTVVTGIPNSGKSPFVDHLCMNLAEGDGIKIGYFSPENGRVSNHVIRLIRQRARKQFFPGYNNRLDDKEIREASEFVNNHFHFIMPDNESYTVDRILDRMSYLVSKYGINVAVVDPYNTLEHLRISNQSETEYIGKLLNRFKYFAREHNVHFIQVAHPAKMLKQKDSPLYEVPNLYSISGCYSDDTEILTEYGWILHKDYNGQKVCCFNKDNNSFEYHRAEKVWEYDYEGEMHHYDGESYDFKVTPNHRIIYKPYWETPFNDWRVSESKDLKGSAYTIPMANSLKLIDDLPDIEYMTLDGIDYKMDDFLEYIGYYISEGCIISGGLDICQALGEVQEKMKNLLDRMNLSWKESIFLPKRPLKEKQTMWRGRIRLSHHREFTAKVKELCGVGSANVHLPYFAFYLNRRQRQILLNALIDGDGSYCSNKVSWRYFTISKRLADELMAFAIEMGILSNISIIKPTKPHHSQQYSITGNVLYGKTNSTRSEVSLRLSRNLKKEFYKGKVYCLTVPTGFYVTRRNGFMAVQGNSANWFNVPDNGLTVYRQFSKDMKRTEYTAIYVQKVKFDWVGKPGNIKLYFDVASQRFEEEERGSTTIDRYLGEEDNPF